MKNDDIFKAKLTFFFKNQMENNLNRQQKI